MISTFRAISCDQPGCSATMTGQSGQTSHSLQEEAKLAKWSLSRSNGVAYCPAHVSAKVRRAEVADVEIENLVRILEGLS